MEARDHLEHYNLDAGRGYRYLRTEPEDNSDESSSGVREDPKGNVKKFQELEQQLLDLGFQEDQMETLCSLIAAILNLGEVRFKEKQEEEMELENPEAAMKGEEIFFKYVHCFHSNSTSHHHFKFINQLPVADKDPTDL
jgi:hypothetical protein